MLLRCCQSVVIALALCLIPDVEAGIAQSARDFASELETSDAQGLILPSEEVDLAVDLAGVDIAQSYLEQIYLAGLYLADNPPPESSPTPEFSDSSAPEVTQTEPLPTPTVTIDDFLNQPTIGSQLLLPPGEDAVQLLLAPAPDSSQRTVPLDSLSGLPEGERQTSLAPISSQRFLPAATQPVGLLPAAQEKPANPVTIAIENTNSAPVQSQTPARSTSPQAQVGRALARTTYAPSSQAAPAAPAPLPRSTPTLLAASTVPPSPLPQRSASQSLALSIQQTSAIENQSAESPALVKPAQKVTPAETTTNPSASAEISESSPNPNPSGQSEAKPDPTAESNAVASGDLGITIAPPEAASLWESWKNQIWIAVGALAVLGLALIRWGMSGGKEPLPEVMDWDHLPRSKSKPIDKPAPVPPPAKPKRVSEEFLQFMETGGLAPLRDKELHHPIVLPQNASLPSSTATEKALASSTLLERKPRHRDALLPWEDQPPETHPKANSRAKDPQRSFKMSSAMSNMDPWIWVPIVLIALIGVGAWLIQFYGWGLLPSP